MRDLLIAQMCNELEATHGHALVIALESLQKLHDHTGMSVFVVHILFVDRCSRSEDAAGGTNGLIPLAC